MFKVLILVFSSNRSLSMASLYPGPFCTEIGITSSNLDDNEINSNQNNPLLNGVVLELKSYADKKNKTYAEVIQWIKLLKPQCDASVSTLRYRILHTVDTNKKLQSKKKVQGFQSAKEYKSAPFNIQESEKCKPSTPKKDNVENVSKPEPEPTVCYEEINPESQKVNQTEQVIENDIIHGINRLQYELQKKQRQLKQLKSLVEAERDELNKIKLRKGHYSVRNVEKRDTRSQKARQQLHEKKMTIFRQNKIIEHYKERCKKLKRINHKQKQEINGKRHIVNGQEIDRAKLSLLNSEEHVQQLMSENEELKQKIKQSCASSGKKKQSINYFKRSLNKLKSRLNSNETVQSLKLKCVEKDREIQALVEDKEILQGQLENNFQLRNADGSFNNTIRLCVIELAGLEVAVEKIPKVIQAVSSNLFAKKIENKDLPTKSTTQAIIDEGHYLAKKFIAYRISAAENFGVSRDGTSRKKQKILDTSVTLDTGEVMSLGFTRVARETADAIDKVTKHHVHEMSEIQKFDSSENYIRSTLEKLSFSMSDRASNEKAADRLLDEWRDSVLKDGSEQDTQKIHHFHCMAHVLLGFHKYACDDIKALEVKLVEQNGPLGRDSLPQFKFWKKSNTAIERVVRTVSETFGPAGDHLGLRDRWEAHCCEKGVKSVIGNYRDNRFNGLFQTSAEVYLHTEDMLAVINTVQQPNRKLIAVKADLQCGTIQTFLQCFGLFYLKVTGPYWNLVTSGTVPYLMLYSHIQCLAEYLKKCTSDPSILLKHEDWLNEEVVPNKQRFEERLYKSENSKMFQELVTVIAWAMLRCLEKQLSDFLPGGQFSSAPNKEDLRRTEFAHATNLGCEHHFGDLDSSQKRRPNASLHHHSTVQMLKRNRCKMMAWLSEMPSTEKETVLKQARQGGKDLRQIHLKMEKDVLSNISKDMKNVKKSNKRKHIELEDPDDIDEITCHDCYNVNEYVAVAYQDMWYPGVIEDVEGDFLLVNFMASTTKPGIFTWPSRKDRQRVSKEFILKHGFVPQCQSSGRLWFIEEHQNIMTLFEKYCKIYF